MLTLVDDVLRALRRKHAARHAPGQANGVVELQVSSRSSVSLSVPQTSKTHNVDKLLDLALALAPDLAHLERDEVAERLRLFAEHLADLAEDLSALGAGHLAERRLGLDRALNCPLGVLGGTLYISMASHPGTSYLGATRHEERYAR